ncbi:SIR2 family NAD-dependent protein deacylase [Prevotella sp. OH937_COT-195]|uniref:SIR2 family NAD-dependent protein deacylase n=1 Tax=Prevotella sp. OH937_COT-195 TaxID=2491051 RepID=UPI000F648667|nr:Sir2 family NAD-dependent protein deacetylase [Prevotella sp. OH937_COT-195]RRC98731.1 NAD-dependent protein deacylase [Prevotella sp. OH937_COT-195]
MKKIVVLTGAGMSVESGLSTFRADDGLWENNPVSRVATHEAWESDPEYVNAFYNMLRTKYNGVSPNNGHLLVARLEEKYDVTVVTQNVDNLHEAAGSTKVIHLHGELMKACSSRDVEDTRCHVQLGGERLEIKPGELAADGSLLRPYIVFFGEAVPNISVAADCVADADIVIIIGTSMVVYPAAGLVRYARNGVPVYLIDPNDVIGNGKSSVTHIKKGASAGMEQLFAELM